MISLNTYLTFDGQCEAAFEFYKSIFGGEFTYIGRFKDMPPQEGVPPITEEIGQRIMHVSHMLPNGLILMGSDTVPGMHELNAGNNFSLSINAESEDEANKLFGSISSGGMVTMPMEKTFWGAYFGMCTDKFGINWMFNYDYPQA